MVNDCNDGLDLLYLETKQKRIKFPWYRKLERIDYADNLMENYLILLVKITTLLSLTSEKPFSI